MGGSERQRVSDLLIVVSLILTSVTLLTVSPPLPAASGCSVAFLSLRSSSCFSHSDLCVHLSCYHPSFSFVFHTLSPRLPLLGVMSDG